MGKNKHVIVLHGLALDRLWMMGVARKLSSAGYTVHNISYPSRHKDFVAIVDDHIVPLIRALGVEKVDFVAHSMGGILVRIYAEHYGTANIGRVVMLGTPNHGSEAADYLKDVALFKWYFGYAGQNLGTSDKDMPAHLGPVKFECGVIAGSCHWCHFPTPFIVGMPRPNDGIVAVESTKVEGMKDHIVLNVDHSLMVWSPEVWRQAVTFLETGSFQR